MKQQLLRIVTLAVVLCCTAFADPAVTVELTNAEVARLFTALRSAQAGLTPTNTYNCATNINTLRPFAEAFERAQGEIESRSNDIPMNDPERARKVAGLTEEMRRLALEKRHTVSLLPFVMPDGALTADEIRTAKIGGDSLAEFIRFLTPPKEQVVKK